MNEVKKPKKPLIYYYGIVLLALLLFMLAVTVLSLFLYCRDDELIRNNSGLFHDVQSWFTLI